MGHHDHLASGFRRRCHTLDSQLHPSQSHSGVEHIDRSQERVPRFMAGVTRLPPSRRTSAAPLNQSYDVDNPSPSLLRPHVTPDLSQVKMRMEPDGSMTVLRNPAEQQDCKTGESVKEGFMDLCVNVCGLPEETQRRMQALEDMQRRLEEEHALQMSLLLAEQEKEQQRLRQVNMWNYKISPPNGVHCVFKLPLVLSLLSPGFPSPLISSVSSTSVQPPVYLWGPAWGANRPRARLSLVSILKQRALCRLGAITRGFLTRRLLKTEKVKHLRQTVLDTQQFICSFQSEAPQRRGSISAQDVSLQERVRAQLRAALYDVHDIFFEMPLEDRLALLQQDRELRAERKLREMVTRYLMALIYID
uniref:Centriolar coiled-coil protein 110 n=1 Tax=Myripristis murdjan TaxID=586833 RepID=A0A667WZ74_9TELE